MAGSDLLIGGWGPRGGALMRGAATVHGGRMRKERVGGGAGDLEGIVQEAGALRELREENLRPARPAPLLFGGPRLVPRTGKRFAHARRHQRNGVRVTSSLCVWGEGGVRSPHPATSTPQSAML
jgi:hypothetical protein